MPIYSDDKNKNKKEDKKDFDLLSFYMNKNFTLSPDPDKSASINPFNTNIGNSSYSTSQSSMTPHFCK